MVSSNDRAGAVGIALTVTAGSMLNAMQFFPPWVKFFNNPQGSRLGLLSAMYQIGSVASLPFVPILSDHFGRKVPIITGCFIMIAAAAIQGASINLSMFEGARFFMGFGNSLAQLSSPLLLTEICHPQHRGRITAVYNCLWNVGALICSWISFGTSGVTTNWSWRVPTLIQAFPSVICICFIWFIPESPRWLISKDRGEQAHRMLAYYHADDDITDPTVQFEFEEIKETLRLEFLAKKSSSYFDFFRTKGNRYRLALIITAGLFSQWSGNALISYYANIIYKSAGVTSARAGLGLDGGNKVLSLIVSITCAMLCDRIGRRPLFLAATGGMLLFFFAATICSAEYAKTGNQGTGIAIILFVWLHGVAYALAWSGLLIAYTVEILPFKLRAKGLMIMNVSVQCALLMNNYVNPIPLDGAWKHSQWKLYCVYTAWIAVELVIVYFLYVETKYVATKVLTILYVKLTYFTGAQLSRRSRVSSMATRPRSVLLTSRANSMAIATTASTRRSISLTRTRWSLRIGGCSLRTHDTFAAIVGSMWVMRNTSGVCSSSRSVPKQSLKYHSLLHLFSFYRCMLFMTLVSILTVMRKSCALLRECYGTQHMSRKCSLKGYT
jgi:sugar porter (SP) family MFS transporter